MFLLFFFSYLGARAGSGTALALEITGGLFTQTLRTFGIVIVFTAKVFKVRQSAFAKLSNRPGGQESAA